MKRNRFQRYIIRSRNFLTRFFKKLKKIEVEEVGAIMVSNMVGQDGEDIHFVLREKNDVGSGWAIFSGFEDDDYSNDHNNWNLYSIASVAKMDISILDVIYNPPGAVFERTSRYDDWQIVKDYQLNDDYLIDYEISPNWSFKISEIFLRRQDPDEDLVFVAFQRTVRIHHFKNLEGNAEELYEDLLNFPIDTPIVRKLEMSDERMNKFGFIVWASDGKKDFQVLYNASIINNEVIHGAIYFDDENDLDWAIKTLESIKYTH